MIEKTNKTKILVQIWPEVAAAVRRDLSGLHIKRDSYFNALFAGEIEQLEGEVHFRTPDEARTLIKRRLRDLKPQPLTIVLDRELVDRMGEILHRKNISRNAFINRVLFFLIAKSTHLDQLGIYYTRRADSQVKPLDDAWGSLRDPFFNIRDANDGLFYSLPIYDRPLAANFPSLFGLNCAISDAQWEEFNTPLPPLEALEALF
jgi:hypothetical protein